MPQCWRCERVLATAELRRSPRGFVCKDNNRFSRCAQITRELVQQRRRAKRGEGQADAA